MADPRTCTTLIHVDHVLFKPADGNCHSAIFEVGSTPAIITGFEFSSGACAHVEMVAGCAPGEYFSKLMKNCGCAAGLNEKNNQLIVSIPGRYRLVWCDCATDEGYVELNFAHVSAQTVESCMAGGSCCDSTTTPTLVSTNPCLVLANPSALVQTITLDTACLCTALQQSGCIPAAKTFTSSDNTVQITAAGTNEDFTINCGAVKNKCGFITLADLCPWVSSLPAVGPLQP
jgi:hypothetical protein